MLKLHVAVKPLYRNTRLKPHI